MIKAGSDDIEVDMGYPAPQYTTPDDYYVPGTDHLDDDDDSDIDD